MARLKIYGIPKSRAFRNLWVAKELGIEHELVTVGFGAEGTQSDWYRAINPNGRIPAIRDGDFVLWESLAINLYLAKKHGKGLYPATLEDEARVWQWTLWAANEVEKPLVTAMAHRLFLPPEKRSEAAAAEALEQLARPLGVLDTARAGSPWLVGDSFTVADLNLAGVMYATRMVSFGLAPWPQVAAWLARCYDRPAAQWALRLREG